MLTVAIMTTFSNGCKCEMCVQYVGLSPISGVILRRLLKSQFLLAKKPRVSLTLPVFTALVLTLLVLTLLVLTLLVLTLLVLHPQYSQTRIGQLISKFLTQSLKDPPLSTHSMV